MNIKEAKQEIKNTVRTYLQRDEYGEYIMPVLKQRPILLMGAPGIGKTQIMEQIAEECDVALVSYTITHHTRQSAVGLPMICEETFDDMVYSVTEYTMSEIIASMYREMKKNGKREGILFLDEINCVSETLAPAMLQFLQCKTFGNRAVPEGWIIVAAGNPPEYNKSVREFDMVTWDRVRRIDVEADLQVWREYARKAGVYGAILGYLEVHPENFYRVENDVDGLQFVTARGWEDVSHLLESYRQMEIPVDEEILYEYLRHRDVAEDMAAYLELYEKYEEAYPMEVILAGKADSEIFERLTRAAFDERITVVELILDKLLQEMGGFVREKRLTDDWYGFLKEFRVRMKQAEYFRECYMSLYEEYKAELSKKRAVGYIVGRQRHYEKQLLHCIKSNMPPAGKDARQSFEAAREGFELQRKDMEIRKRKTADMLEQAFTFLEDAFSDGEEMIFFVTELTLAADSVKFLAEYPCEKYLHYSERLLIGSRRRELLSELEKGR